MIIENSWTDLNSRYLRTQAFHKAFNVYDEADMSSFTDELFRVPCLNGKGDLATFDLCHFGTGTNGLTQSGRGEVFN